VKRSAQGSSRPQTGTALPGMATAQVRGGLKLRVDIVNTGPKSLQWTDVRSWRVLARRQLIKERLTEDRAVLERLGKQATHRLLANTDLGRYPTLGVYSPMRGEIDIHEVATEHLARGGYLALPVVVEKASPVEFWRWQPGMPMARGIWNILVPATRERVMPDALIVPLVGFDASLYRLGYGGGYYDRTLAQAEPKPYCVGLGLESGLLASVHPQTHDIPMDRIVTDQRIYF
jgi:5-formyltetrahydrofolate cyclo-ligase